MIGNVIILGSGPGSMFITMACNDRGIIPTIFGTKSAKPPMGAFYYHWLPEAYASRLAKEPIRYTYIGSAEGYSKKQWAGEIYPSSFGKYGLENGYNVARTHELYLKYADVSYMTAGELSDSEVISLCRSFYCIFCTFPLKQAYAQVPKVKRPVTVMPSYDAENFIVYNGAEEYKWVRKSNLFGNLYIEYCNVEDVPGEKYALIDDIYPEAKVPEMFHPSNLHFIGRYAEMNRTLLAHDGYFKTLEILDAL